MKAPVLYVEHQPCSRNSLTFDFCYSAKMGAELLGVKVKVFEDSYEIPGDPTNIVVGSVEKCSEWLHDHYNVPEAIDLMLFEGFLGRSIKASTMEDFLEWFRIVDKEWIKDCPTFIKPRSTIKAFTGFIPTDEFSLGVFSHGYDGPIWMQTIVDIISEYRLYVSNHKIVGMKHYSGDPLIFPDSKFIRECFEHSKTVLNLHSYTLDFGVLADGSTILVEANDGWAIGNYGLDPKEYYLFVRNRWLQMTGIRHRMDY